MSKILNNVALQGAPSFSSRLYISESPVSVRVNTNKSVRLLSRRAFNAVFEFQIVAFVRETRILERKYHSDR